MGCRDPIPALIRGKPLHMSSLPELRLREKEAVRRG